jgi:cysteine-rich repeat protein
MKKTLTKKSNNLFIFSLAVLVIFGLIFTGVFPAGFGRAQEAPSPTADGSGQGPAPTESPVVTPEPVLTPESTLEPSVPPVLSSEPSPSVSASPEPIVSSDPSASPDPSVSPESSLSPSADDSGQDSPTPQVFPIAEQDYSTTSPSADGSGQASFVACGNGIIEESEQCDDGNLVDGDGCNSACLKELVVPGAVGTGLNLSSSANQPPKIMAGWAMNKTFSDQGHLGQDDSTASSSQFMPSGKFEIGKPVVLCALASDPNGLADLNNISAKVFYPQDVFLGGGQTGSQSGCGQQKGSEILLTKLEKKDGLNLFCEQIRNQNNNLPIFGEGVDFEKICGAGGGLVSETAMVACGEIELAYNDPSGDYKSEISVKDNAGLAGTLEGSFKYLELVAFEIDFDHVGYGEMKLNEKEIISGDETFLAGDGLPTVRNIGNTRLQIKIKQDDTGLGKDESGDWNVLYGGRVGTAEFTDYLPESWTNLLSSLNLSQAAPLDLAIQIFKFPINRADLNYAGSLSLSALKASHLMCFE